MLTKRPHYYLWPALPEEDVRGPEAGEAQLHEHMDALRGFTIAGITKTVAETRCGRIVAGKNRNGP